MFVLDPHLFHEALKKKGYRSLGALAKSLGIHRNTIHYYLSGRSVFPTQLEKMLQALNLRPSDILTEKSESRPPLTEGIASLVDQLHQKFPEVTFILFGSRVQGRAHKYSDWDMGVFSKEGLTHDRYREIVSCAKDLAEDLPFFIEVVNLNRAETSFLREIAGSWLFLTGCQQDWIKIQKKVIHA